MRQRTLLEDVVQVLLDEAVVAGDGARGEDLVHGGVGDGVEVAADYDRDVFEVGASVLRFLLLVFF